MTRAVTALGIRDGDVAVLRALVDRRGSAVLAYCERACPPGLVPDAAAEAFARFRALVVASPRPTGIDPEGALLSATRHAAAERAPRAQAPPSGAGLGRLRGGRPTVDPITLVPELLIARADGTLDAAGEDQLNRLLDGSAAARAAEERFRSAEHAYRTAPPRAIPPAVVERIVAAMATVPAPGPAAANGAGTYPADEPPPPIAAAPPPEPPAYAEAAAPHAAPAPEAVHQAEAPAPAADAVPAAEPEPEPAAEEAPPTEPPPETPAVDPPPAEPVADAPPSAEDALEAPPAEAPAPPEPSGGAVSLEAFDAGAAESPANAEDVTPGGEPTVEWTVPPEELGSEQSLDVEIAAARLSPQDEEDAEHVQTASGAVDEAIEEAGLPPDAPEHRVAEAAAQLHRPSAATSRPLVSAIAPAAAASPPPSNPHPPHSAEPSVAPHRHGLPGKGALAPAAAVVAIAAVAALAASGVLGGDDPEPQKDTGIAPKRSEVQVPDGEARATIDELRQAAAEARRQRLTDSRGP